MRDGGVCLQCHEPFVRKAHPGRYKHTKPMFCSRRCCGLARPRPTKGVKPMKACSECGSLLSGARQRTVTKTCTTTCTTKRDSGLEWASYERRRDASPAFRIRNRVASSKRRAIVRALPAEDIACNAAKHTSDADERVRSGLARALAVSLDRDFKLKGRPRSQKSKKSGTCTNEGPRLARPQVSRQGGEGGEMALGLRPVVPDVCKPGAVGAHG